MGKDSWYVAYFWHKSQAEEFIKELPDRNLDLFSIGMDTGYYVIDKDWRGEE